MDKNLGIYKGLGHLNKEIKVLGYKPFTVLILMVTTLSLAVLTSFIANKIIWILFIVYIVFLFIVSKRMLYNQRERRIEIMLTAGRLRLLFNKNSKGSVHHIIDQSNILELYIKNE